jgi:hypothetical protein
LLLNHQRPEGPSFGAFGVGSLQALTPVRVLTVHAGAPPGAVAS